MRDIRPAADDRGAVPVAEIDDIRAALDAACDRDAVRAAAAHLARRGHQDILGALYTLTADAADGINPATIIATEHADDPDLTAKIAAAAARRDTAAVRRLAGDSYQAQIFTLLATIDALELTGQRHPPEH